MKYVTLKGLKGISDQDVELLVNNETGIIEVMDIVSGISWTGKKLEDAIGKGPAEKILQSEGDGALEEDGLSVGGEWAVNLYDKTLVNLANKYIKKWGIAVKDIAFGRAAQKRIKISYKIYTPSEGVHSVERVYSIDAFKEYLDKNGMNEEDLKIGMTIPNFVYGQHDAQILYITEKGEEVKINKGFDITPAMAREITAFGQPMFGNSFFGGVTEEALSKAQQPEISLEVTTVDEKKKALLKWIEGTKVVDEQGNPKVCYSGHANVAIYGEFDPNKATAGGFYATEDPEIASNYALGKLGVMESYDNAEMYRVAGPGGQYTIKIEDVRLNAEQKAVIDKIIDAGPEGYEDLDYPHIAEFERYVNENAKFDREAAKMKRAGKYNLVALWQFLNYMGYTIAHADQREYKTKEGEILSATPDEYAYQKLKDQFEGGYPTYTKVREHPDYQKYIDEWQEKFRSAERRPYFERQTTNDFENLLDMLGIDWQSFERAQPGVFAIYLKITNPLVVGETFPQDVMDALESAASEEEIPDYVEANPYQFRWSRDYPLKNWIEDVKNGDEFWATQIPAKAREIIQQFGYDGVKDVGGKGGGPKHNVWIAFKRSQIRSAIGRTVKIVPRETSKPVKETKRMLKYKDMIARIKEIKDLKADFKSKVGMLKDMLWDMKNERKDNAHSIKRYKDGYLDEEYGRLPVYYRTTKETANTLDSAASELGIEGDMAVIEHFIDLDRGIERLKEEIKDMTEKLQEDIGKKVILSEISSLKKRVTDFMAGLNEATKMIRAEIKEKNKADAEIRKVEKQQIEALRKEVIDAAKKLLPASGKKYFKQILSAIEAVKKAEDAPAAVARIVDTYDQWLEREKRMKAIKEIMKKYKQPENIIDAEYQTKINETLDKYAIGRAEQRKALKDLNTDELMALAMEIANLREQGKISFQERKKMKKMASEIMRAAAIRAAGGTIDIDAIGSLEEGKASEGMSSAETFWIQPLRLVRKIFGKFGEIVFYDTLDKAESIAQSNKVQRLKEIAEVLKKYKLSLFKLGSVVEIDGKTFQLNQIMTMYAQRNNEDARNAIIFGNKIDEKLFDKFTNYLKNKEPDAAKAVDEIKEIVSRKYEELRTVMLEMFNIDMPKVKDYFPMHRQRLDAQEDPEPMMGMDLIGDAVLVKGNNVDYAAVEKGFTITRQQISERNQKPISLDFLGDAMRAVDSQEHFLNFSAIQKMYNSIKTDQMFVNAIVYNHGRNAWKAFDDFMNVAINPRTNYRSLNFVEQKFKAMRRAISVFYLGYNLNTIMVQLPSIHLALKYTSFPKLYSSLMRVFSDKKLREKIMDMDPTIRNRAMDRSVDEIMQSVKTLSEKDLVRALQLAEDTISKNSFQGIINMDRWVLMAVYNSVYEHQLPLVGEKEARNLAHKAGIETQQQGRNIDLPAAYRSNEELLRMMLMFTTQLNQIYNMIRYDLPAEWQNKDYDKALVGISSIMITSFFTYIVQHGGAWPDDEEKQFWAFFDAIFGSFISAIPIIGNLFLSFVRGYSPTLSPAQSIADSLKYTVANFKNEKYVEAAVTGLSAAAIYSEVSLPVNAIRRSVQGLIDLMSGETDDLRRLIWSKSALFEQ